LFEGVCPSYSGLPILLRLSLAAGSSNSSDCTECGSGSYAFSNGAYWRACAGLVCVSLHFYAGAVTHIPVLCYVWDFSSLRIRAFFSPLTALLCFAHFFAAGSSTCTSCPLGRFYNLRGLCLCLAYSHLLLASLEHSNADQCNISSWRNEMAQNFRERCLCHQSQIPWHEMNKN
jgi:hypothetical protein